MPLDIFCMLVNVSVNGGVVLPDKRFSALKGEGKIETTHPSAKLMFILVLWSFGLTLLEFRTKSFGTSVFITSTLKYSWCSLFFTPAL